MKRYGDMTPAEREAAWRRLDQDDPFAAPYGFTEWAEANEPAPACQPTRKQQRWGTRRGRAGWGRRRRG